MCSLLGVETYQRGQRSAGANSPAILQRTHARHEASVTEHDVHKQFYIVVAIHLHSLSKKWLCGWAECLFDGGHSCARHETADSAFDWVLAEGFNLSYHNKDKETILFTIDPYYGNLNSIP